VTEIALNLQTGSMTEYVGWSGRDAWAHVIESAELAESLGFDEVTISDHLLTTPVAVDAPVFECWTAVAAVAARTSRIRIGQLVQCASFRSPAVVAKAAATVDILSGGRLRFGIGAGWFAPEHEAFDIPFLTPRERATRMAEAVRVVRGLWSEDTTSFDGDFFRARDARSDPKPLQPSGPPIMIAGTGPRYTLPVVAELADIANITGSPEQFRDHNALLDEACEAIGREPAGLTRTWGGVALIREDMETARDAWSGDALDYDRLMRAGRGSPDAAEGELSGNRAEDEAFADFCDTGLVGGPDDVLARMQRYVDCGVEGFHITLGQNTSLETVRRLGEDVLPRLASRGPLTSAS
jgi:alkanesulfonate monooxygenase SsuD/methylene tetrahydromethanopterin reductase-like flavin-dependent oxidoreductase (luciferase family)